MPNKIYYLSTCDTCKKILKEINPHLYGFQLQDIKTSPVTPAQLEELKALAGSYEQLFSKRAQLYKQLRLAEKQLTEEDYKNYLLQHYTFLKRPVVLYDGQIFTGSDRKVMESLNTALKK